MGYIHRQVVLQHLGVVKHFLNETHRPGGNAGGIQPRQPVVVASGAKDSLGFGHQAGAKFSRFRGMGVVAIVKANVLEAGGGQHFPAQGVVQAADDQHPVGGLIKAVVDVARRLETLGFVHRQQFGIGNAAGAHRIQRAAGLGVRFPVQGVNADEAHSEHHQAGAQQRCFQFLPPSVGAALPGKKGAANRPGLRQPAGGIHQRAGNNVLGDAVGNFALAGGNAGHRLNDDVVAGALGIGPMVSKSGAFAVDDGGVDGGEGFVIYAQPPGDIGAVVGENNIGAFGEAADDMARIGSGEIEGERAFAPVVGHKGAPLGRQHGLGIAPEVAPRRFHLNDAGAHIGQQHTGGGGGNHGGELHHLDALQRAGHSKNREAIPQGGRGWAG